MNLEKKPYGKDPPRMSKAFKIWIQRVPLEEKKRLRLLDLIKQEARTGTNPTICNNSRSNPLSLMPRRSDGKFDRYISRE